MLSITKSILLILHITSLVFISKLTSITYNYYIDTGTINAKETSFFKKRIANASLPWKHNYLPRFCPKSYRGKWDKRGHAEQSGQVPVFAKLRMAKKQVQFAVNQIGIQNG